MAEEYVSQDRHRADLLALRGELKEEIAGICQDIAVLSKNVEHLAQTMRGGLSELRQNNSDLRQDMRSLNTTVQRQMWALIAVVVGGVIKVGFFS